MSVIAPTVAVMRTSDSRAVTFPVGDDTTPYTWQDDALCNQTDPEIFFPEKGGSTREAKQICTMCSVRDECLTAALENDERFGIWGGLSDRERRRLRAGADSAA